MGHGFHSPKPTDSAFFSGHRDLFSNPTSWVPPMCWHQLRHQNPRKCLHKSHEKSRFWLAKILIWLVVWTYPSEKWWSESQLGWWYSQLNGKIKFMFQTTNQLGTIQIPLVIFPWNDEIACFLWSAGAPGRWWFPRYGSTNHTAPAFLLSFFGTISPVGPVSWHMATEGNWPLPAVGKSLK